MIGISLCMIVRDEEETLARCLDSVRGLVEETVVVDTGSADATREIARTHGARLFDFPWRDDFAAARNYAFAQASMDYCLWLDADDVLEAEDAAKFRALKETLEPDTDVVMLPYHTDFDASGAPRFTCYRERLLRRAAGFLWQGAVHEAIVPAGKIVYGDAAVSHRKLHTRDPGRNLRILERRLAENGLLSPRERFYYARELAGQGRDEEAVAQFVHFLREEGGWLENRLEAHRNLAACLRRLGRPAQARRTLLAALSLAPPRAELCCDLGGDFLAAGEVETAAFWYELALRRPRPDRGGGFVLPDCYGYLPLMQLCLCSYRLGNRALAEAYNARAGALKPNDPAYLHNIAFFQKSTP